ncbi:ATP synthase F0 subunit C [Bdellovibrio sp.]|uniref:ATP synthase F0 subunit C n=1 Tax=Bdellovibrio sp. TaxID=28201 RepID=UPI003221EA91
MKKMIIAAITLLASSAFAQESAAVVTETVVANADRGLVAIAAAIAISLSVFAGAMAQGKTASTALEGIARNPAASGKLLIPMILGLALIESLVIYALIIALGLK